MSNRRLLLIVGAISVLGGIGVAAAILHVAPHAAPTILRWDEDGERDGTAFGRDVDATGCVAEAIRRVGGTLNFKRRFIAGRFLKACLEVAERDPELCDGVPSDAPESPTDGQDEAPLSWRLEVCRRFEASTQSFCLTLVTERLQRHCWSPRSRAGADGER